MAFIYAFLLGLVMIGISYAWWYYMQPFKKHRVDISLKNIKSEDVMYKQYTGSYNDIKSCY